MSFKKIQTNEKSRINKKQVKVKENVKEDIRKKVVRR